MLFPLPPQEDHVHILMQRQTGEIQFSIFPILLCQCLATNQRNEAGLQISGGERLRNAGEMLKLMAKTWDCHRNVIFLFL